MTASQAVVCYGQQRVRVRRKIDPNDVSGFIGHQVQETWVLVTVPIVILPPYMGCQQIVQRSDGSSPGQPAGYVQPFGMLVDHRVDNVNECFIAREQAMSSGKQVSFKPALA